MNVDLDAVEIVGARVTDKFIIVVLADGREVSTPLSWYPVLAKASHEERQKLEISPFGVHWPNLDEDLSVAGMLRGNRPLLEAVVDDAAHRHAAGDARGEVAFADVARGNIIVDFPDFGVSHSE